MQEEARDVIEDFEEQEDTVQTVKRHPQDVGFNATDYSLQKRYRPRNDAFVNERWYDNTFYSVFGGTMLMSPVEHISFSRTGFGGVSAGKWLNPYHGVRLSLLGETMIRNTDNRRLTSFGMDASYIFNMTSYIWGYRRDRFCELSPVMGLGYRTSLLVERRVDDGRRYTVKDVSHVLNAHLGLNLSMKMGRYMDIFFEPVVYLQNDAMMQAGNINWRHYNFSSGVKIGMSYNLLHHEMHRQKPDYLEGSFISVAGGFQYQHSALVIKEVGFLNSIGPHLSVSYGKVYADDFAFRASLFWSMDIWNMDRDIFDLDKGKYPLKGQYGGIRLELMYDVLKFIPGLKDDFPLAVSLMAGPELGIISKEDKMNTTLDHGYLGITGGVQAKYRVLDNVSIFAEPRFSVVPYSHPYSEGSDSVDARSTYFDLVFNLNFGVELNLPGILNRK